MNLIDIYGRSTQEDAAYDLENCWFGRVLETKNGKFEGITQDYYGENTYFIFGTITPVSIIVTRCPIIGNEMSKKFDGLKEKDKYYGTVSVIYEEEEEALGECIITLLPAELTREITDFEVERLKERIQDAKKQLSPNNKQVYNSFLKRKENSKVKVKK